MSFSIGVTANIPRITQTGGTDSWSPIDTMIAAVATIAIATAYAVGDVRKPPAANGAWYRCTTAGTTAGAAPLYNPVSGSTTTDGTAVFTAFLAPFSFVNGDGRIYCFPEIDLDLNGALTNPNPSYNFPICRLLYTSNTANFVSGTFAADGATPLTAGVHFIATFPGPSNFGDQSTWDGAWSIRGGQMIIGAAVKPFGSGAQRFYGTELVASKAFTSQSIRLRSYSTNLQFLNGCENYDVALDAFNIPTAMNIKAFNAEYVSQYVGSAFGGTDAKMSISALSNKDGTYDFDNYAAGWVEIDDCAKGAALVVVCQAGDPKHCVPLYQNVNFTISNLQGVVQDSVRAACTDAPTNSPTATITTIGGLKTWDFRNPLPYSGITAGGGLLPLRLCLKVWYGSANTQNLRFPASTATVRFCGYKVRQFDKAVVLGSDTAQAISASGEAATNTPLSEAAAAALTGIALAPSGATNGTATVTVARTVLELWQYFRAWKPLNMTSDDTWLPGTTVLGLGAWNLTCTSVISASGAFNEIATTGTISSSLTSGGAYTYVNGSLLLPLAQPTLTGGTLNIGAATTYALNTDTTTISMTPTSASTYTFTGTHSNTLSLKNTSAFAITVVVPAGTTTSTASNVGGAITVTNPPVTLQLLRPNIIDGSNFIVRNVTQSIEIAAGTCSGGSGINVTFTKGTHYNTSDTLSVIIGYCVGTSARLTLSEQITAPASASVNSAPTAQTQYAVYNSMAINGSTVAGFTADYAQFDVNVTLGSDFLGQNFMAWWVYNESTLNGLRNFTGLYTLVDAANMMNNASIALVLLDNTSTTNIKQVDNVRIYCSDGTYPVKQPSTGGGAIDINWRNPVLVTGLGTVVQDVRVEMDANSTKLTSINSKTTNLPALPASTTNITAGTITNVTNVATVANVTAVATVTNLTNAPTNGDITATMKASITAAVPTVVAIRTEIDTNSTKLDVAVSTRDSTANANANAAAIPAAVFAGTSEAGQSYGKQIRDIRAAVLGVTTGGGTTTETFKGADNVTVRVTSVNNGTDRTSVTLPGA